MKKKNPVQNYTLYFAFGCIANRNSHLRAFATSLLERGYKKQEAFSAIAFIIEELEIMKIHMSISCAERLKNLDLKFVCHSCTVTSMFTSVDQIQS